MASGTEHAPRRAQPLSVTVVLVARNEAPRITDAIECLLNLEGPGCHIELIDDGSVDDTWRLMQQVIAANPKTSHQVVTSRFVEPLGERRLLRALADVETDLAIIASPRDHSRSNRVARILQVFMQTDASVVVTDRARLGGSIIEHVSGARLQGSGRMEAREIALQIASSSTNLGTMGLRPEVLRNWAPMSEARLEDDLGMILAFRGSLLGGCYYLDEQLVDHELAREFDPTDTRSRDVCRETMFASLLASRVGLLQDMRGLPFDGPNEVAVESDSKNLSRVRLEASLKGVLIELAERWADSREHLISRGMSPGWEFVADEMPAGGGGVRSDRGRFMSRLSSLFGGSGRSAA
jgi:hypothetical protein